MTERLFRWARRNPVPAITSGLAILGLIAATVASTTGYVLARQANDRTTAALEQAQNTVSLTLESLDGVVDSVSIPLPIGFDSAGDASETLPMFTLDPSPQTARLLERIQPIYEQLSEQAPERSEVIIQTADAGIRLAQIQYQLGRTDDAVETINKCLAQLTQRPNSENTIQDAARLRQARALNELGILVAALQSTTDAAKSHQQAIDIASKLGAPGRIEVARAHLFLAELGAHGRFSGGTPSTNKGNPSGAKHANAAIKEVTELQVSSPQDRTLEVWLARAYLSRSKFGETPPERDSDSRTAIRILRRLVSTSDHPTVRFELVRALSDFKVRRTASKPGRRASAKARLNEALEQSIQLNDSYPNTPLFARSQIHIRHKLSAIARAEQRWVEAAQQLNTAIDLQSLLVNQFPDAIYHRCWRALLYRSLVELPGQTENAERLIGLAKADLDAVTSSAKDHPMFTFTKSAIDDLNRRLQETPDE